MTIFRLVVSATIFALGAASAGSASEPPYRALRSIGAAHADQAWLRGSWIGRCFPEFAYAAGDGSGPVPSFAQATTVRRIPGGPWTASFDSGRLAPFLARDVTVAEYAPGGDRKRVLAMAYDAGHETVVFQQLTDDGVFAAYVTGVPPPRRSLPSIDVATVATGSLVAPAPPAPARAALERALGAPLRTRERCGLQEVVYRERGATPVGLTAIFDAAGNPRAVLLERSTGG